MSPAELEELVLATRLGSTAERCRARARLALTPEGARALRAFDASWARAVGELLEGSAPSARQEARLVASVLGRTTRQDLTWRGDLRLTLDFLRARLRASPALRIVAASLALHLVAGPVVAYWILHEPRPEPRLKLHIEPPPAEPFAALGPEEELLDSELVARARRNEAQANARARARFILAGRGASAPLAALAADAPPALELLAARARFLRAPFASEPPALGAAPSVEQGLLAAALWCDAALDRHVLAGTDSAELGPTLQRLEAVPAGGESATETMIAAVLWRARELGLSEGVSASVGMGASMPIPGLLSRAWFQALREAGQEAGLADSPLWRAWLAWGLE